MKINNVSPIINNDKSVAFKGCEIKPLKEIAKDEVKKLLTLQRNGPMSRHLFLTNAFVFLLGSRLVTSRDKDEKREIFIRDVPSIVAAVFGVPFFQKIIEKKLQGNSGIATMRLNKTPEKSDFSKWIAVKIFKKDVKELDKGLKPEHSSLTFNQIKSVYKYDENLSSGLRGFSERLCNLNEAVDLKKMYSNLPGEIKQGIEKIKANNNQDFIKALLKDKKLSGKVIEALKSDKNAILKKAEFLKTIPIMTGFGITLALLGLIVPRTNIFITETISKHRQAKKKLENATTEEQSDVRNQYGSQPQVKESKKAFEKFATNN